MHFALIAVIVLALLFLLYLFLIAPTSRKDKQNAYAPLLGWDYAHRGLHDGGPQFPENSLPAFQRAMDCKFGIELDVQLTADDQLVVFHDKTLKRVCGEDVQLGALTLAQLRKYRLHGGECSIPTFDEFLDLVGGKVPLIIEIKFYHKLKQTSQMVWERLKTYSGAYCIESFHPMVVRWFWRNAPEVVRGQLSNSISDGRQSGTPLLYLIILSNLLSNALCRPDFIAYNHSFRKNLSLRLACLFFHPLTALWTIRSREDYLSLKGCYDMLIFEQFLPNQPSQ